MFYPGRTLTFLCTNMKTQIVLHALVFFTYFLYTVKCTYNANNKLLSRKRRYLAFPEGSALSAVFCLTNLMGITPGSDIFSMNINWGIIYELPNETKPLLDVYKPAVKRRTRRDLYGKIEKVLTSMGYDGRSCILRSLCEAGQRFKIKENSLIYHILSLIFRFPQDVLLNTEPESHKIYHNATLLGVSKNNEDSETYPEDVIDKCAETFRCPFSLIDLALGYHSHI